VFIEKLAFSLILPWYLLFFSSSSVQLLVDQKFRELVPNGLTYGFVPEFRPSKTKEIVTRRSGTPVGTIEKFIACKRKFCT
jgi:hypothetical protein